MRGVPGCAYRPLLLVTTVAVGLAASAAYARDEDLFIRPEDQHVVLFGELDAGRSSFLTVGSKQPLTGTLDRPGFLLLESTGVGLTHETARTTAGPVPTDRFKVENTVMLGRQWTPDPVYVAAFIGPELEEEQLTYRGRIRNFAQPKLGARAQVEIWARPTDDTLLTATLVGETARFSFWARFSGGYRVWTNTYLGPEVTVYSTSTYNEVHWGAHLTGPTIGPLTTRISAGWMSDDAHRRGSPYVGLSAWLRL